MLSFRDAIADADPNNQYGYVPSKGAGIAFLILFSLLSIAHLGVTVKSRVWWSIVLTVGGLCEILGWAGRTWAAINPDIYDAFIMQEVLLIIAPCFYSAAVYGFTGMLINAVGPEFSLLRPHLYLWLFCSADFVAIVIQAAGGALAGTSNGSSQTGTHTMVAGIVFQLVCMFVYAAVAVHFLVKARRSNEWHSKLNTAGARVNVLIYALAVATLLIILRGFYRTVELAEGWRGFLITHESYFLGLDGVPMVLCMLTLLIAHPFFSLPSHLLVSVKRQREVEMHEPKMLGTPNSSYA